MQGVQRALAQSIRNLVCRLDIAPPARDASLLPNVINVNFYSRPLRNRLRAKLKIIAGDSGRSTAVNFMKALPNRT